MAEIKATQGVSLETPFVLITVAGFLSRTEYKRTLKRLNKRINQFDETRHVVRVTDHKRVELLNAGNGKRVEYMQTSLQGRRCRLYVEWYTNGQMRVFTMFKSGLMHGRYSVWRENGLLRLDGVHAHGRRHGLFRHWHATGQPSEFANYDDGALHGRYQQWCDDGRPQTDGHYVYGQRHGEFQTWNYTTAGVTTVVSPYIIGVLHGRYQSWHGDDRTGPPQIDAVYEDGMLDGKYRSWSRDGILIDDITFKAGRRVGGIKPDPY